MFLFQLLYHLNFNILVKIYFLLEKQNLQRKEGRRERENEFSIYCLTSQKAEIARIGQV